MSFEYMINQANFDVITLSKTLLKNDKYLLEYFRLHGYEFTYRNRDEKPGGDVEIYIRNTMGFKVFNGISKFNESIGHLWVINSACLIGIFYQLSSENNKKIK